MTRARRTVLAGLLVALVALAAAVLFDVLGTVFFAVTVAYVLAPVQDRLTDHGFPARMGSAATTAAAAVVAAVPLAVVGYLAYRRREDLQALVSDLPDVFVGDIAGLHYELPLSTVQAYATDAVQGLAATAAVAVPVLALKAGLFVLLVFGLLARKRAAARALLAPVPAAYHDVAFALHERTRDTLFAIYVLQVVTAIGTFAFALPLFYALGYQYAVTLAVLAGVLQFLPIIGPSVLVAGLAAYEASVGAPGAAVVVLGLGLLVVAALPDLLVRPLVADRTARLPGALYYVGFVGGLLTLGPVGIVAGPLAVALVVEAGDLLADSTGADADGTLGPPDDAPEAVPDDGDPS